MAEPTGKDDAFVSQDEIDRLLSQADESPDVQTGASSDASNDAAPPEETASADDAETFSEPTGKDDAFVSQDEIDRLLSQADELTDASPETPEDAPTAAESETAAEVDKADPDAPVQDISDDFDALLEEETFESETDADAMADAVAADRVILEEVPEAPEEKKPSAKSVWPLDKDFWIVLTVVVFFGTASNGLLWMYNKRSLQVISPEVLSFPVVDMPISEVPKTFRLSPRAVTLKGFLVPAPIDRKDLTYITADVSLELTHSKAVSLIKAHAPFYRNIIYDVIKRVLGALDKSKISEISLKIEILKALNGSVPERSVRDVVVDTFVMY